MSERAPKTTASTLPRIGRRRALTLGGAACVALATGLEWASLRGSFDHRRAARASAKGRYEASRAALDEAGALAAGVVHVGHSTHLLGLGRARLLTDPWFYDPAFGALSHDVAPAVAPDDVGRLDAVLVSHDHADHADLRAMDRLDKRALVIVATRDLAARVRALGFAEVTVLAPWESLSLGEVSIAAVPAEHDVYEVGFVVRGAGRGVYFAGDTRLHPALDAIAERYAPDTAILPVDGTRLAGGSLHVMTPEDAVVAARTLKCRVAVPSHAEARFSDPLVEAVLATTISHAAAAFVAHAARELPHVVVRAPSAGELVSL